MQLNYQFYLDPSCVGSPTPVIIIPGLFGSTANWRSFAKKLSQDYPVFVIDQRNHGDSPHADTNSYQDMVNDLLAFINQHDLPQVSLCGHSMGGKVAMLFALQHPNRVARLAVLDIAPITYSHSHAPFLVEMMKVDLSTLKSRSEADRALKPVVTDTATRLFLLQSLTGSPGEYRWRLNLPVLLEFMPELVGFPTQTEVDLQNDLSTCLLLGGLSSYVPQHGRDTILEYFPSTRFEVINDAGHWLHAEQPEKVLITLKKFLQK